MCVSGVEVIYEVGIEKAANSAIVEVERMSLCGDFACFDDGKGCKNAGKTCLYHTMGHVMLSWSEERGNMDKMGCVQNQEKTVINKTPIFLSILYTNCFHDVE